jgi:short-subunit dehydrogenase
VAGEDYYCERVAVITGAGSGIGRALALELAERGASLALSDQETEAVDETARLCRRHVGARVRADRLDVTDRAAVEDYARLVAQELGRVDLLFAVAGVIHTGRVVDSDFPAIDRVIDVNLRGVINVTKVFLPLVIARPQGHIVTVSSAFGLVAAPYYSAYNASKFAVRGFTESLRQEMKADGHPVAVTGVYPGGVRTPILRNGSFAFSADRDGVIAAFEEKVARTSAENAASMILRGVARGRAQIMVGTDARVVALLQRVMGSSYQELLSWIWRRGRIQG